MFIVKHKKTDKVYTVYSAVPELNTTWFLFYENNMWSWRKSNNYEPYTAPIEYVPTVTTPWWEQVKYLNTPSSTTTFAKSE